MMQKDQTPQTDRRDFLKKTLAIIIGGAAMLAPVAAGMMVIFDPLRRKLGAGKAVKVALLDALPNDGVPHKFPVLASRTIVWNKFNQVPVGAVYLRRTGGDKVEALNVVCPHAGCLVDFKSAEGKFVCPCHNSSFTVDGKIDSPSSPAPRGLDTLEVEVRKKGEIWVTFQNFKAGQKEKEPLG